MFVTPVACGLYSLMRLLLSIPLYAKLAGKQQNVVDEGRDKDRAASMSASRNVNV